MHTKSHWQTVDTYMKIIEKSIIPYKNKVIASLGLDKNQVTILKHDLRFTHKDARVLTLLKANNIIALFVPAGCTDLSQECDTLINKPFKDGLRKGFRDHMTDLFSAHLATVWHVLARTST
jgi:hypothetical protein